MRIERYGSGPKRYFGIHGWSGSHRTFEPLAPHLPVDVSLYAPDLPASPTLDGLAQKVAAEIADLAPLTAIGNCSGGLFALRALQHLGGTGVDRLVLIDPLAHWPWYLRALTLPLCGHALYSAAFATAAGRWTVNRALAGNRAAHTNLTEGFARADHAVLWNHLKLLREIREPSDFRGIETPIQILYGARTLQSVRDSFAEWRAIWPHATFVEIAGAGHTPIADAPESVATSIFTA